MRHLAAAAVAAQQIEYLMSLERELCSKRESEAAGRLSNREYRGSEPSGTLQFERLEEVTIQRAALAPREIGCC